MAHAIGLGLGLSPRVRGNRCPPRTAPAPGRSIPACAGEPGSDGIYHAAAEVYPRVCGGTCLALAAAFTLLGLSPRVRGNLIPGGVEGQEFGSIPACAGEPGRWC